MGQRMDQPDIEYGNDCLIKFAADETPEFIYARFSGISTCPGAPAQAPNDRVFKLTQDNVHPCFWHHDIGSWYISFHYNDPPNFSRLFCQWKPTFDLFFLDTVAGFPDEGKVYHNEYAACVGVQVGTGGIGIVTWTLEALEIMSLLNIDVQNDLFMEMHPIDDGSRVYKFCKTQDATNIKILYDP